MNLTLRIKQVVGLVQGRHHHYLIAMLLDIAHEKLFIWHKTTITHLP
ncbi:hypothetical protein BAZMOX_121048_1 [methanotrophic endosymbiont of Bathymodiolus azoricus (Menez Gwen)]|nr:hypothetical protein BAZMOX_121048_1 [methanotrophic endosymbiont of Bathymodiolus azoricus (Menez Gwen)]